VKSTDTATASDGFGTLAEAGWTRQVPVHGAMSAPGSDDGRQAADQGQSGGQTGGRMQWPEESHARQ
jgi:hypothetical protein